MCVWGGGYSCKRRTALFFFVWLHLRRGVHRVLRPEARELNALSALVLLQRLLQLVWHVLVNNAEVVDLARDGGSAGGGGGLVDVSDERGVRGGGPLEGSLRINVDVATESLVDQLAAVCCSPPRHTSGGATPWRGSPSPLPASLGAAWQ